MIRICPYVFKNYCTVKSEGCKCQDALEAEHCRILTKIRYSQYDTLLIVGSRSFKSYETMDSAMSWLLKNLRSPIKNVISGAASGADSCAAKWALAHEINLIEMSANWDRGRSAGYRRNNEMHLRLSHDDYRLCVAFWDGSSTGTAHNFELCRRYRTPCVIFTFDPNSPNQDILTIEILGMHRYITMEMADFYG